MTIRPMISVKRIGDFAGGDAGYGRVSVFRHLLSVFRQLRPPPMSVFRHNNNCLDLTTE